jgi:hypothetical protein
MMKKFGIAIASLVALAVPATSKADSGRWLGYPTCMATTTTLTCSGRATIPRPRPIQGLGPPEAAIIAQVRYHCSDPESDLFFPDLGDSQLRYVAAADFANGQTFSIQFTPPPEPWTIAAQFACNVLWQLNDPNYYNVSVVVGWGFGSGAEVTALDAPIGLVAPQ